MAEIVKASEYTFEEAVEKIRDLEKYVANHEFAALHLKFKQGEIVAKTQKVYGEDTLGKLSEATYSPYTGRVSVSTLRSCEKVYNQFASEYEDPEEGFKQWLRDRPDARSWMALDNYARGKKLPSEYDDDDMGKLIGRLEKTGRDFEKLNELVASERLSEEEASGVKQRLMDEFNALGDSLGYKRPVPKSEEFKAFVRSHASPFSGDTEVEFHHIGTGGMGMKASDFGGIPMTHEEHMEYHAIGRKEFEAKYNANVYRLAFNYFHRYITGQWFDLDLS